MEKLENQEQIIQAEEIIDESKKTRKQKKLEKKARKINNEFFREQDINYKAPLSYRHLRLIAWIAFAVGQLVMLNETLSGVSDVGFINPILSMILSLASSITLPLFMIATFGTILNNNKSFKSVLMFYGIAYIGIGVAIVIAYHRYINGILTLIHSEQTYRYAGDLLGSKLNINVFSDLLALSAFYFFATYHPKKYFQGKKIRIFRLLSLIPLLIAAFSYVIEVTSAYVSLPVQIYPFLTTKSPMLYLLFVLLVLWLKKREKKYLSYGKTYDEYQNYLKTRRNAKSFSIRVSILLAIISVLDLALMFVFYFVFEEQFLAAIVAYQVGDCALLFLAIPVIMFYSYNKTYDDDGKMDILIPLVGIGLCAFAYVEGIYQIVMVLMKQ